MGLGSATPAYGIVNLSGTTDASGDATVTSAKKIYGELVAVFIDGTNLTGGANLTVKQVFEGINGALLVNNADVGTAASNELYPRMPAQDAAGTAVTYDGTNEIYISPPIAGPLQAIISAGGNAVAFTCHALVKTG